jgi:hypothetical protein
MADENFEIKDAEESEESSPFIPLHDAELQIDDPGLQMDAGLVAWVQCASSFCLSMGTWGVGNSFGTYIALSKAEFAVNEKMKNRCLPNILRQDIPEYISLGHIMDRIYSIIGSCCSWYHCRSTI